MHLPYSISGSDAIRDVAGVGHIRKCKKHCPFTEQWNKESHRSCISVVEIRLRGGPTYRSNTSSSNWVRSQAIYSSAASVIRGHHERSSVRNFCKFSAISSTPSSVTLLQPDNERTVKCGSECTEIQTKIKDRKRSLEVRINGSRVLCL